MSLKLSFILSISLSIYISPVTDSLHLSIYMLLSGTVYLSDSIYPSRAKTVLFYTERFVLGTHRHQPITVLPSKNASGIWGESSDSRMIHVFVALVKCKPLNK